MSNPPNVKIYILCHTEDRYQSAKYIYRGYVWAVPIKMKYQDETMENAFWKQLLEIQEQWTSCEMVGTLSFSAYTKLNLSKLDTIIRNRSFWNTGYFHFFHTNKVLSNRIHPHLTEITTDICKILDTPLPTENFCNYWMCKPDYMKEFIPWFHSVLKPLVCNHPLAYTDATYRDPKLSKRECQKLFGVPYYPHTVFVLERMNRVFFDNREKFMKTPLAQKLLEQPKRQETDS